MPLSFAYASSFNDFYGKTGSSHRKTKYGDYLNVANLAYPMSDGLYEHFFKLYDECLKKGMHKITSALNLSSSDIVNYNFFKSLLINGSRYIPNSLKFEITDEKIKVIDAEFLLLH